MKKTKNEKSKKIKCFFLIIQKKYLKFINKNKIIK